MVTPGYGVNLPSLSTQLIQDSVVRQRRFEFEFEIGVNKNDQRDAVGFWGQKKSGFNKQGSVAYPNDGQARSSTSSNHF